MTTYLRAERSGYEPARNILGRWVYDCADRIKCGPPLVSPPRYDAAAVVSTPSALLPLLFVGVGLDRTCIGSGAGSFNLLHRTHQVAVRLAVPCTPDLC